MNPYMSWAIVLVVAGGLGYYYSNTSKPKSRAPIRAVPEKEKEKAEAILPPPKQKKPKTRKQPESTPIVASKSTSSSTLVDTTNDEAEEGIDNKEFAKRLAAARSGVSVGETKPKARKEKHAKAAVQESTGSELSTRAPSSNGADADDDLSSTDVVSPSAGDVSDMLEQPAPGPSVLRLTGSFETKEKKAKAPAFKPVETKKQRQNRQKNESRKQANQEAEAERRKLLEKQLHTAREAERREAGRKQSAAPATNNAWANNTTNGIHATRTTPAPAVNAALPLLDTFDPTAPTTSTSQAGSSSTWTNNLPPEEEQMRILGIAAPSVDEDWTTVSSKKEKAKKKAKADDSANEASAPETAPPTVEPELQHHQAPGWEAPKVTEIPVPRGKNHPLDSDWAA
ncbi:hypothetical protein UA08_04590 [Talaromyces atroroseus]|uniref:Uncharacterized protein n=1 Tax=Talaromyces atroroseus TaxID=1441469 RepID=A0A225ARA1_TALAT|nr:hypothetical protein UA08_04590 [Talaromyces atroroseus]OKL59798.1 hypothetical protein UA08_04590 [Talaromyces atroroseus]